jgi:hypothetical protein
MGGRGSCRAASASAPESSNSVLCATKSCLFSIEKSHTKTRRHKGFYLRGFVTLCEKINRNGSCRCRVQRRCSQLSAKTRAAGTQDARRGRSRDESTRRRARSNRRGFDAATRSRADGRPVAVGSSWCVEVLRIWNRGEVARGVRDSLQRSQVGVSRIGGRSARCNRVRRGGRDSWRCWQSRHRRGRVVRRVNRARSDGGGGVARPGRPRSAGVTASGLWHVRMRRHHRCASCVSCLRNSLSHLVRHLTIRRAVFINGFGNLLRLDFRHPDFVPRSAIDRHTAVASDRHLLRLGLTAIPSARDVAIADLWDVLNLRPVTDLRPSGTSARLSLPAGGAGSCLATRAASKRMPAENACFKRREDDRTGKNSQQSRSAQLQHDRFPPIE